jgi:8-oxo-dGTP pyrophosphatase MutT (NUDIX family)
MAVMTDPMPGTGAIIPHVVEVEARDDVRVVVQDGPWPVDPALRAGGAAHLAALRRRVPAMHDGPVLAMTAVSGGLVHARRAGYFDMVATADALAHDPGLRGRAAALAGEDPLRRGDGRVAALGLSVAATLPDGRVLLGRRRAELPLDPGAWHVVPSGMLEPGPDPIAAAVAREALEELGVAADPGAVRTLGLGWDLARLRPEVCVALELEAVPARAGGDEFDVVEAFAVARPPQPLTAGAACALALLRSAGAARFLRSPR